MSKARKNIITLVIVVLLSAGGSYLFSRYSEHMKDLSEDSLDWPSVTGLVTYSNMDVTRRNVSGRRTTIYRVEIDYEYIVDDDMFENDVVQFNQNDLSKTDKERLVSAYPVDRQVEVFYNPLKPKQSVLVRGSYP